MTTAPARSQWGVAPNTAARDPTTSGQDRGTAKRPTFDKTCKCKKLTANRKLTRQGGSQLPTTRCRKDGTCGPRRGGAQKSVQSRPSLLASEDQAALAQRRWVSRGAHGAPAVPGFRRNACFPSGGPALGVPGRAPSCLATAGAQGAVEAAPGLPFPRGVRSVSFRGTKPASRVTTC